MPAKSEAQRRYLASRFGPGWMREHHFDNTGKLPERLGDKLKRNGAKRKRHRKG